MIIQRFNDAGRYETTVETTQEGADMEDRSRIYVGVADITSQYHDFETGQPKDMPTKPSQFHKFDYTQKQWVPDSAAAWSSIKQQRSQLLNGSDWVVTKAIESGRPVSPEWATYRQALRDITLQDDPLAITWPESP